MFGFFVAALSAAGLIALGASRRRFGHGFRGPGLYRFFQRLDASPAQEKVMRDAFEDLRNTSKDFMTEAREARGSLANIFRGSQLDEHALRSWFESREGELRGHRARVESTLKNVHEALDDRQRQTLSDWLERGPRFGFRHHHYHHHYC